MATRFDSPQWSVGSPPESASQSTTPDFIAGVPRRSLSLRERGGVRASVSQTVSHHAGHVTKASDPFRAYGAMIGKAMSSLPEGKGLILVLVGLQ
jgi:hypothetical protein